MTLASALCTGVWPANIGCIQGWQSAGWQSAGGRYLRSRAEKVFGQVGGWELGQSVKSPDSKCT